VAFQHPYEATGKELKENRLDEDALRSFEGSNWERIERKYSAATALYALKSSEATGKELKERKEQRRETRSAAPAQEATGKELKDAVWLGNT